MVEAERPIPNTWEHSTRVKTELTAYLQDAELGSAKFLACQDYLARLESDEEWDLALEAVDQPRPATGFHRLAAESRLRMVELKRVLQQTSIESRKVQVRGYLAAYSTVTEKISQLIDASFQDATRQMPDDPNRGDAATTRITAVRGQIKQMLDTRSG